MTQPVTLEQLRDMQGHPLPPSRWFGVTQAMIDAHAEIVEDRQFIHIDPVRAAATPFGTTIAHGFLTLGLLSAMAYDAQPTLQGAALSVNYGMNRLRFVAPVPAESRLRAHFTLADVDQRKPGEITLTWTTEVEIEGHPKPALVADWLQRHFLDAA